MRKTYVGVLSFLFVLGFSFLPGQETQQASLSVTGMVNATVSVSAVGLDFGELSAASSVEAESVVSVTTMPGTVYNIALDAGQNYDGETRQMTNHGGGGGTSPGTIFVRYHLAKNAGEYDMPWGDSDYSNTFPEGSSAGPFTGDGTTQTYTVYGMAEAISGVILETFSDLITVTVHY